MSRDGLIQILDNIPPPSVCCQGAMLLAAACIFAVAALPREVKNIMMDYGAREERPQTRQKGEAPQEYRLVRQLAAYTAVPHSWFSSYYYTSVAGLAFWAYQFLCHGRLMQLLASRQASAGLPSMAMEQVYVTWGLMALQGTRRLLESWALVKPSKSKMGVLHWLLGIAFYAGMSLSVWIEGSQAIREKQQGRLNGTIAVPVKTMVAVPTFLLASVLQNGCHRYLTSLKKYSLPEKGLFRHIVCPHYTCECVLYAALALGAAPEGRLLNRTLLCALVFAATNLGVTAKRTKDWYAAKFGPDKVAGKWAMIPFVF